MSKLFFLGILFYNLNTFAQVNHSIGLALGAPNALVYKGFITTNEAYAGGIQFSSNYGSYVFGDYHIHHPEWIQGGDLWMRGLKPYYGIGAFLLTDKEENKIKKTDRTATYLGVRIPLGIEWKSPQPIAAFLEITPGLSIIESTQAWFAGNLGVRWYF